MGAKNQLNEIYSFLSSQECSLAFQNELNSQKITWKFSVPSGPHMSGIWESAIKSAKNYIYKIIANNILSYEEMVTVLAQVECLDPFVSSAPMTRRNRLH